MSERRGRNQKKSYASALAFADGRTKVIEFGTPSAAQTALSEIEEASESERLEKFWGIGACSRRETAVSRSSCSSLRKTSSNKSAKSKFTVGSPSRTCTNCHRPYNGFGTICSDCRKAPKKGTAKLCAVCFQFYSGFGTVCEDCKRKQEQEGRDQEHEDSEDGGNGQDGIDQIQASQKACPLLHAVYIGDTEEVLRVLRSKVDLNQLNHEGVTPLICASATGKEEIAKLLIEYGADPRQTDAHGVTALHCAAFDANLTIVKACLSARCDVDAIDAEHWSPLHLAVHHGTTDDQLEGVVRTLLGAHADPVSRSKDGTTPLSLANAKGLLKTAALLKTRSGQVGHSSSQPWPRLHRDRDEAKR